MIPPGGFEAEKYPLRHRFNYSVGLNMLAAYIGHSTYFTLVRNYKSIITPTTIDVNPHHATYEMETGAVCSPMSIIDKLRLTLKFNLTEDALADGVESASVWWQPVFTAFKDKLDAVDVSSTIAVKDLLELVVDETEEDVTPLFNNVKSTATGESDLNHPLSTENLAETVAILNMDTDARMEFVSFDNNAFHLGMTMHTTKGAMKSLLGRRRFMTLTKNRPNQSFFINKFVPRAIRRIVPYTYFGILIHVPTSADAEQHFYSGAITTGKGHIGVKALIQYNEWNPAHNQEMTG